MPPSEDENGILSIPFIVILFILSKCWCCNCCIASSSPACELLASRFRWFFLIAFNAISLRGWNVIVGNRMYICPFSAAIWKYLEPLDIVNRTPRHLHPRNYTPGYGQHEFHPFFQPFCTICENIYARYLLRFRPNIILNLKQLL